MTCPKRNEHDKRRGEQTNEKEAPVICDVEKNQAVHQPSQKKPDTTTVPVPCDRASQAVIFKSREESEECFLMRGQPKFSLSDTLS